MDQEDPATVPGRDPGGSARRRGRALQAYYLATPLFAVLDFAAGINVRVAFLDGGWPLRLAYYAFAFVAGVAAARWPARAALVGLVESGANIALLVLGVGVRYLAAIDAAAADAGLPAPPFDQLEVVNLLLSAVVLAVSYIGAQARPGEGSAAVPGDRP